MTRVILIGVAGALGTLGRYFIGLWAGKTLGTSLPYGTLIVNVAGCFLLAAIAHIAMVTTLISPTWRLTLTTGFMGGFTTYSSFNLETTNFVRERAWLAAVTNLGATVCGCLLAGFLGLALARRLVGG
jgi:fluoride exporter